MVLVQLAKHEDSTTNFSISSDFTGSDGVTGRTYDLSYAGSIRAGMIINVDGQVLQATEFSFSSGTITFNVPVYDDATVSIDYFIEEEGTSAYSTTTILGVVNTAGIGQEVVNETVGTGNGSATSYELDESNIIDGSYTLKYASSGSNAFTELTETTHYTIDMDGGTIELTSAGVTALGTNVLYADYLHSPKINNSGISHHLTRAQSEVELITGNYWGGVKSTTETFDGRESSPYPTTDLPYVDYDSDPEETIQLSNKSVQSITSVKFLARGSGDDRTISSSSYTWNSNGLIVFYTEKLPVGKLAVEVTYTHGYSSVPTYIKELTEVLAGIMIFSAITGGSYDDATSFTLGRKAISIGEVYVNVRETVRQLEVRRDYLMKRIGTNIFVC